MNELPPITMILPEIAWTPWMVNDKTGERMADGSVFAKYRLRRCPVAFERFHIHAQISKESWALLPDDAARIQLRARRIADAEHKLKYIMQEFSTRREIRLWNEKLRMNMLFAVKTLKWISIEEYIRILKECEAGMSKLKIQVSDDARKSIQAIVEAGAARP